MEHKIQEKECRIVPSILITSEGKYAKEKKDYTLHLLYAGPIMLCYKNVQKI